jgi:DNA-directed RNA polymerase specialized sigma24 family protein
MIPIADIVNEYGFMMRQAGRLLKNRADQEDLVHDTLIKALENANKAENRFIRAWLNTILYNTFITQCRLRKPPSEPLYDVPCNSKPDLLIDYDVILKNTDQSTFLYAMGYKYEEIAELKGKSPITVRVDVCRNRKKLRELWAQ